MEINDLPGFTEGDLLSLESKMNFPGVFRPHVSSHSASQAFLRREGVWEAWARTGPMEEALAILRSSKLRQIVETLLLSPVKSEPAVRKINNEEGVSLSIKAYELFKHYFWNTNLMSGADWGVFLNTRQSTHDEWLQLALESRDASGVQLLLWKTGYGGLQQIEANKGFSEARDAAFMLLRQIFMQTPSKNHADMMLSYVRVAKLAQEGVDSSAAAVQDVVESFNAFRLRNVETKAPSVVQLTQGNYSPAEIHEEGEGELEY
jgi:hypothetical protein